MGMHRLSPFGGKRAEQNIVWHDKPSASLRFGNPAVLEAFVAPYEAS